MSQAPTAVPPAFEHEILRDRASLRKSVAHRLVYSMGKDPITATTRDWYNATAYAVRERLIERWMETMRTYYRSDAKRVYYLSMEFLTGRVLSNSLLNMGFYEACREALSDLELNMDEIREIEPDAALGNGGLGRLAACFLDSMATLSLPGYGYGIRYQYGMFAQQIEHGYQVEQPDNWLRYGNPWEFPRPEVLFPVKFGGRVVEFIDEQWRLAVPLGGHGRCRRHGVRYAGAGLRHDDGQQHAPVVGQGLARLQPEVVQRRQLLQGGSGEERVREPVEGALPGRHDPGGQGAAAQAAVLLRLCVVAGHPAALHRIPRRISTCYRTRWRFSSTIRIRPSRSPN